MTGFHPPVRGFTLTELLVAMVMAAILCTWALPACQQWVRKSSVSSEVVEFQSALRRARSEAVRASARVTVCARDASAAVSRCRAEGEDWGDGWLIFLDHGDPGQVDPGDVVVHEHQPGRLAGRMLGSVRYLSFQPIGVAINAASHFRFMPLGAAEDDLTASGARLVCVNKPGRSRVTTNSTCSS